MSAAPWEQWLLRGSVAAGLLGIGVRKTDRLERGQTVIALGSIMVGTGIRRGVPHRSAGMERGYLLDKIGAFYSFLDAATGAIVYVHDKADLHEHDERPALTDSSKVIA